MKLVVLLALSAVPRAQLVSAYLLVPARLLARPSAARSPLRRASTVASSEKTPATALLLTCRDACDSISPLVRAIYATIPGAQPDGVTQRKPDNSVFTLADGLVQALLVRLLRDTVGAVVGEEDGSPFRIDRPPYSAGALLAPASLSPLIEQVRTQIDELRSRLSSETAAAELRRGWTAFIDPIDGTREFSTGRGEDCTILIGFADAEGRCVAGIVYRPLDQPATWALGCAAEDFALDSLRPPRPSASGPSASRPAGRFLCTNNGALSPFLTALADDLGYDLAPAGGAGNKMLLLLEGEGQCYIQDRGLSRWDTCAAQAVLEARGGTLAKLSPCLIRWPTISQMANYRYMASETNTDFVPGLACFTKYNSASDTVPEGAQRITDVTQAKPHANLCGLVALPPTDFDGGASICDAVKRAAELHAPEFS